MKLPIGQSDFQSIIKEGFIFVDKSLLIKDIVNDNSQVSIITRPRRFGKTLNLSMLHYFFSLKNKAAHEKLFESLKIAQEQAIIDTHQGNYPVIYLSLKDINSNNFNSAFNAINLLIQQLYQEHAEVLLSAQLSEVEKANYRKLLEKAAEPEEVAKSLWFLSYCLFKHYEKKVIILIDEYDTPILASHDKYFAEMISFMRTFYGAALKDNLYLFKGVMTGILRVAKENIFSGLNNLKVFTLLNSKYGEYFGFTDNEINELLAQANLLNSAAVIKEWYNGYNCGEVTIYNPWSIISCLSEQGVLQPYWVNTSSNELIQKVLTHANVNVKQQFESLLLNEKNASIVESINETLSLSLSDVATDEQALWSLLVFSGYLKVINSQRKGLSLECQLAIPNYEVKLLYQELFKEILVTDISRNSYKVILAALTSGQVSTFCEHLKDLLEQVVSNYDTPANDSEKFYHSLILGLACGLQDDYMMEFKKESDKEMSKESGYGRFDLVLIPKDTTKTGIILEFKKAAVNKFQLGLSENTLPRKAGEGLKQINSQLYQAIFKQQGIKKVLLLSLAFAGKTFTHATEEIKLC